jgi:hypothetical protein
MRETCCVMCGDALLRRRYPGAGGAVPVEAASGSSSLIPLRVVVISADAATLLRCRVMVWVTAVGGTLSSTLRVDREWAWLPGA